MIHPTAIVDACARLAEGCEIGPYAVIGADVEIGERCWIGPHVVINGPTRIGRENRIYQFASIGEAPQDMKYGGEPTWLEIGHRNVIREFATINRGTVGGGGVTRIGDGNLFMAYVHVAHDCVIGNHAILANNASLAGHVEVGDYAILGGFTTVHQFSRIGAHSFSGQSSVVTRDVPPFVTVAGNHANAYGINKEGLRRRGFDPEVIHALYTAFKLLVRSRARRADVMARVDTLAERHAEVSQFVEFIAQTKRGIVRSPSR